jgi:putative transposase
MTFRTADMILVIARPDNKTPAILATNDFERSAEEIADLYRQQWEIE